MRSSCHGRGGRRIQERRENARKGKPKLTQGTDPDAKGSSVNGRADLDRRQRSFGTRRLTCCGSIFPSPILLEIPRVLFPTAKSELNCMLDKGQLIPTDKHAHILQASAQVSASLRSLPGLPGGVCHSLLQSPSTACKCHQHRLLCVAESTHSILL